MQVISFKICEPSESLAVFDKQLEKQHAVNGETICTTSSFIMITMINQNKMITKLHQAA